MSHDRITVRDLSRFLRNQRVLAISAATSVGLFLVTCVSVGTLLSSRAREAHAEIRDEAAEGLAPDGSGASDPEGASASATTVRDDAPRPADRRQVRAARGRRGPPRPETAPPARDYPVEVRASGFVADAGTDPLESEGAPDEPEDVVDEDAPPDAE